MNLNVIEPKKFAFEGLEAQPAPELFDNIPQEDLV
jgi:hypothetical protein